MIFIYNCYGGSHSSVTAAAIHLGLLPDTRIAYNRELLNTPYYDAQVAPDHGRIRFMGFDEMGNRIYISSKRNLGSYYGKLMRQFTKIVGIESSNLIFIDTMPYVNIWMIVGGYLSRRLGIKAGRTIILYGTRQSYYKFIHLVNLTKMQARSGVFSQSENYLI